MGAANESAVFRKRILSFLKPGLLLIMLLMLTGCESLIEGLFESDSSSGGGHSRGVPLSKAMEASASNSHESLHGSRSSEHYSSMDTSVAVTAGSSSGSAGAGSGAAASFLEESRVQLSLDAGYSVPFNGQFESITRYTFQGSFETDRACFGFYASLRAGVAVVCFHRIGRREQTGVSFGIYTMTMVLTAWRFF